MKKGIVSIIGATLVCAMSLNVYAEEPVKSSKDNLVIAMAGDCHKIGYAQNGRMVSSLTAPTLLNCVQTETGSYEYVTENSIVESYEWTEDNSHIVLKLRQDVPMHDGTMLDAYDVECSIENADLMGSVNGINIDFDNIEVVDDYTVDIGFLSSRISNWKDIGERMIFSKEAFEEAGDFDVFTTSSAFASYGPYRVKDWMAGDTMTFEKFDDYFLGNDSTIKTITIRRIDEATVSMMELQTGGVDMILYPAQSDIDDVKAELYENIKYQTCPGLYQQLIVFNLDASSVCADVRVRQAICYAIDKQAMWEGAFESSGILANTVASQTLEFMKPMEDPYPQDLEKAKKLLEDAGVSEGSTLTVCVDNDPYRTTAVEMFKNAMGQIGINVEIKTGDNAAYLADVTQTVDWDLEFGKSGSMGSIAKWLDGWWTIFHHGDTASEDFSECLDMVNQILSTYDETEREQLTDIFVEKFAKDWCLTYPIRQDEYVTLINAKLEGFSLVGEQVNLVGAYFTE